MLQNSEILPSEKSFGAKVIMCPHVDISTAICT